MSATLVMAGDEGPLERQSSWKNKRRRRPQLFLPDRPAYDSLVPQLRGAVMFSCPSFSVVEAQSLQNCNDWQEKFSWGDRLETKKRKDKCENNKRIVSSSDRRRPRVQRGRATQRATRRNDRAKVAPRLCPTDNQPKGGRRRDRSGEKGRRREWQMEL